MTLLRVNKDISTFTTYAYTSSASSGERWCTHQMIVKLRCRVTEAKVNLKGTYDYLDCRACHREEENQKHILFCPVLNDNRKLEEINYEKLYNGTVSEKVKIAKRFKENFKILEKV